MQNLDKLHIMKIGEECIRLNLYLYVNNVVDWCKNKISSNNTVITYNGKNWYVSVDNCILTINAYSYTIITAHRK